jgi:type IV secretion system protein VirB10
MQPAPPPKMRGNEPALVVDLTAGTGASVNGATGDAAAGDEAVRATLIRSRSSIIPQGAIIAAVLETPLNSDRPGLARAAVSQDARSFDGSRVLIPRGSRLIGEFKADTAPGLRRVLVTWTRLIRPDGVAIRIGSPVSDSLGGAGAPGKVNTHFFERFATAILQSALTIGVNVASQLPVDNGSVYVGIPGQAAQVGQALVPTVNRPPTVKVREGAQIAVFVARDLDFGGTPPVR